MVYHLIMVLKEKNALLPEKVCEKVRSKAEEENVSENQVLIQALVLGLEEI